ncbi:MAG: PEP-CTERM sorting domain-containing protein, partial [Opitutaceae bacterium]
MNPALRATSLRLVVSALSVVLFCSLVAPVLRAQATPSSAANNASQSVLFIGNSFMFGAGSPVRFYRAPTVTDLNGEGAGGVPALFKAFTVQAGRNFAVSLETSPGKNFDYHVQTKSETIGRAWDNVVALGYSTLDQAKPGDPTLLIKSAGQLAELLHGKNPQVDIRLVATWSRADQTYPAAGHWHGQPIEKMALDVRAAYNQAAAGSPFIRSIIPVGEAWNRAMKTGVADPNPYDGIAFGQ